MTAFIAVLALVVASAALVWRRRDPWLVRVAGVSAVAVAWFAARDRWVTVQESKPSSIVALVTGETATPPIVGQVALHERAAEVDIVRAATPELGLTIAAASLDRPGAELVLVWNAALTPTPRVLPSSTPLAQYALTTTPRTPLEPRDFELRTIGPWRVGRPGALELRAESPGSLPPATTFVLHVFDADDRPIAERRGTAADLVSPITLEVDPIPDRPAPFSLRLEAAAGATHLAATGTLPVAPPRRVGVHGRTAAVVIEVLRVQGIDAVELAAVDPLPADVGTVIALDPLPMSEQQTLADFVTDRGGGLFVVGGESGGALAAPGEPLHELLPIEVLPRAPAPDPRSPDRAPSADPTQEPHDPDIGERHPDPVDPTEPDPDPPRPPDSPDDPPVGEIGDATPPASTDAPKVEVERRRVAMVLVIDESGSMSTLVGFGRARIDYAKRSAFDTARALDPTDLLAIVTFADAVRVRQPLGPIPPHSELKDKIEQIGAVGSATYLDEGLAVAFEQIQAADAAVKHVVLLTDGDAISSVRLNTAEILATRMRRAGITLSVVHVSSAEAGPILTPFDRIAKAGGGRLVATNDATTVPRLLVTEVRRVQGARGTADEDETTRDSTDPGRPPATDPAEPVPGEVAVDPPRDPVVPPVEQAPLPSDVSPPPSDPARSGDSPLANVLAVRAVTDGRLVEPLPDPTSAGGYPVIHGIVDSAGRAEAWIVFVAGERGLPLLAFANRGLGRIGAWSADWTGAFGAAWRDDPSFPARLAQWVAHLEPASEDALQGVSLLTRAELTPTAPLRAEVDRLLGLVARPGTVAAPAELTPLADYVPPARRLVVRRESRAVDDALLALAAAVLLACIEFAARRM